MPARVLTTDPVINIRLACEGTGLTMAREDRMREEIARGELVRVLEEFSPSFPGYYCTTRSVGTRRLRCVRSSTICVTRVRTSGSAETRAPRSQAAQSRLTRRYEGIARASLTTSAPQPPDATTRLPT